MNKSEIEELKNVLQAVAIKKEVCFFNPKQAEYILKLMERVERFEVVYLWI